MQRCHVERDRERWGRDREGKRDGERQRDGGEEDVHHNI